MNIQAVIDLIYRCELKAARKALRPYRDTDEVARKAFDRLNNIISENSSDIYGTCKRVIRMLQESTKGAA